MNPLEIVLGWLNIFHLSLSEIKFKMVGTFILTYALPPQHYASIQTHVSKNRIASQLWFPVRPSGHRLKQIEVWIQRGNRFSSIFNICNGICREIILIGKFSIQHFRMLLGKNKAHTEISHIDVWDIATLMKLTQKQRCTDFVITRKNSLHFFLLIWCHYMPKIW